MFDRQCNENGYPGKSILSDGNDSCLSLPSKPEKLGQARSLNRIESFVDTVIQSRKPAYIIKSKPIFHATETHLGRSLREVIPLARMFDAYECSEKPMAFLEAYRKISCIYGFKLTKLLHQLPLKDLHWPDVANMLVEQIRHETSSTRYKRAVHDRRYAANRNGRVLAEYTSAVLASLPRVLVVRLDIGYQKWASDQISIDTALSDLHEFLEYRGHDKRFRHLVGYAWVAEQGRRGFHFHMALFFDGSKVRQDVTIGFSLGNFWSQHVTNGKGRYYNCNAFKEKYKRLGIGMVYRNDENACANVIASLEYLPKSGAYIGRGNQYLRIRPKHGRGFGTGRHPLASAEYVAPLASSQ